MPVKKPYKNTSRLRKVNEKIKSAAEVIQDNLTGRPPKYHAGFVHIASNTALIGSTNSQLASMFGVDTSTVDGWMVAHPLFSSAIKRGRDATDRRVEAALLARAEGYSHPSEEVFCSTRTGQIVRAAVTKQYPPSETAMIFWLKNRRPQEWRDRVEDRGPPPEDAAAVLREQMAAMDKMSDEGVPE